MIWSSIDSHYKHHGQEFPTVMTTAGILTKKEFARKSTV